MSAAFSPDSEEDSNKDLQVAIWERRLSMGFLGLVLILAAEDLIEDLYEGEALSHMLIEGVLFFFAILCSIYMWFRTYSLRKESIVLKTQMNLLHKDHQYWKDEAHSHLQGLGDAIDKQFSRWELTEAEKEVGILLLKGLSHKEIANIRNTSDKTIRHQATSVYKKADLDGRAQLSAFFLEDLLLPTEPKKKLDVSA
jgi:DNA-binding CsgD family transcriptional regulator